MTGDAGDARTEAERIVGGLVGCGVSTDSARLGEYRERHECVVAALAAAIEVAEHVDMSPTLRGHLPDRGSTRKLLAEQVDALSALRARAGEGEG